METELEFCTQALVSHPQLEKCHEGVSEKTLQESFGGFPADARAAVIGQ